ncbi:lasso peptide biosynthesis B2 protein [Streptomyces sp. MB09-01]|uniref:lasso peptide biosynthesis B2 protein n=1 Tax=Streptomyces sp. MB09-01 TaxID=3028666 RepID=UPI0029B4BBC7|nr:lasso peptide biosynthesis B2 protein [Streptomyces sp. MB09-01]MDX3532899.1 lasso peptide biosynthesis B2 protein [Streptomyces sp. MB09-01]
MSFHAVPESRVALPLTHRLAGRLAVAVAHPLVRLPPHRLARLLGRVARGVRPADHDQAHRARTAVTTVSALCAGREGCLPRSVATALLCRARGVWPTWCVGVRSAPPFGAHAWVSAGGRLVGEDLPDDYFRVLLSVPPYSGEKGSR